MNNLVKKELEEIIIKEVFQKKINDKGDWIFDFRRVSMTPKFLEIYVTLFFEKYKDKNIQVCGLESASIPLISAIVLESYKRKTPINGLFIRKSRKKHDLSKAIEGIPNDYPVIIIDDIINTGKSIINQIEVLKDANLSIFSIFTILRFRDMSFYDFILTTYNIDTLFELNDFKESLHLENIQPRDNENIKPIEFTSLWKFKKEGANFKIVVPKSAPLLYEGKLYFGTDSGVFFCLDDDLGKVLWSYKVPFGADGKTILSSPAIYKNTVFFGAYDGNVYALDTLSGKKKWVHYDADWVGSSPSVNSKQGLVYIGLEYGLFNKKGGIVALNTETGKEVWKDIHVGLTHCSPYYSEKNNLVTIVSNDGVIHIYNAKNGKKLKEESIGSPSKESFAESADGKYITFGDFDGQLYTINTKTLELVKKYKAEFAIYSTPLWHKDKIIFSSLDKKVYCINSKDNTLCWEFKTSGRIFASPALYKEEIYIGSNDGRLYKINIETGMEMGYLQFSERIVNKVCVDEENGFFYIPTIANELYKIKIGK